MANTVRPQASTRPNPTYVPPVPAEDDPLNPELGSDRPLYSTDPARDKTLTNRQIDPQGSFAPLAWIVSNCYCNLLQLTYATFTTGRT